MENKDSKPMYTLQLTHKQAAMLSYACNMFARCIQGQDFVFQELFEAAWEKRCKEETGNAMDKEWDGGWDNMRENAESISAQLKNIFWGLDKMTLNGVHYDDNADILFDIHQVIRHQLWEDRPEHLKSHFTVDSDEPIGFGSEPLVTIKRIDDDKEGAT